MYIFIENKTLTIKSVKKLSNGWKLIPADSSEDAVFIAFKYYKGKMPPFFIAPWQKFELTVSMANDFALSAFANDKKLFILEKKDYPPEILQGINNAKKALQKIEDEEKEQQTNLEFELENFFSSYHNDQDIEKASSQVNVCWRAYLRLHWLKGPKTKDYEKRVAFMFELIKVASRIYNRHVPETGLDGAIQMSLWEMHCTVDYQTSKMLSILDENFVDEFFLEIKREFERLKLPIKSSALTNFFVDEIRRLIRDFSNDYPCLVCESPRDFYYNLIYRDDERNYVYLQYKMKVIRFESLILPYQFTKDDIKKFLDSTSLRIIE